MQIRWCSTYRFFFSTLLLSLSFSAFCNCASLHSFPRAATSLHWRKAVSEIYASVTNYIGNVFFCNKPLHPFHFFSFFFFFLLLNFLHSFLRLSQVFCLCLCLVGAFRRKLRRVISIFALCFCLCISMCACWYGRGCVQMNSLIRRDAQKPPRRWWAPASVLDFLLSRFELSLFLTSRWLTQASFFSWLRTLTHSPTSSQDHVPVLSSPIGSLIVISGLHLKLMHLNK